MSNAFANEHQDNYFDSEEAAVAANTARSNLGIGIPAHALADDNVEHPRSAFPFSGDHLGTHAHREEHYTPGVGWEPGAEVRRERIHRSDIDLWVMVAA